MSKVKHVSSFMVDVWSSRKWCIQDICKELEAKLNAANATVAGTPILTTGIKDDFLQITIPYFPNSGDGKIEVKYRFVPFKGFSSYKDALQKIDVDSILSDYPVSIQIIHHGDSDDFPGSLDSVNFSSGHILIVWTETSEETTEKKSSLTSEEIDRFTKSAKENNKFAKWPKIELLSIKR